MMNFSHFCEFNFSRYLPIHVYVQKHCPMLKKKKISRMVRKVDLACVHTFVRTKMAIGWENGERKSVVDTIEYTCG